jgi:hypothetical protein
MTRRITPIANIEPSEPEPAATNFDRLLEILERNAASVQEPELVARLRAALRAMKEKSC